MLTQNLRLTHQPITRRPLRGATLGFIFVVMLGLGACQSNLSNAIGNPSNTAMPTIVKQVPPKDSTNNNSVNNNGVNNNGVNNSRPVFTEIPLITDSNRPKSVAAISPPASIPQSWRKTPILATATDQVYVAEWKKSANHNVCPLLVLPNNADSQLLNHSVRRANFSGGWGVAYDIPELRSAYGVANTGIAAPVGHLAIWHDYHVYDDGTELTYGREGGNPNAQWLAYLTLADNHCQYNIWSKQGKAHLEQLIADLRVVSR